MNRIAFLLCAVCGVISGCGGGHGGGSSSAAASFAPVPATACGTFVPQGILDSAGVRFIEPFNVSDAGGLSEHPSIAAGSGGTVYVSWDDDKSGEKDIYFSKS